MNKQQLEKKRLALLIQLTQNKRQQQSALKALNEAQRELRILEDQQAQLDQDNTTLTDSLRNLQRRGVTLDLVKMQTTAGALNQLKIQQEITLQSVLAAQANVSSQQQTFRKYHLLQQGLESAMEKLALQKQQWLDNQFQHLADDLTGHQRRPCG